MTCRSSSDPLKLEKVALDDEEGAMRKGRFLQEQTVGLLREADKDPIAQVAECHGVSEQAIYGWRQRFCQGKVGRRIEDGSFP